MSPFIYTEIHIAVSSTWWQSTRYWWVDPTMLHFSANSFPGGANGGSSSVMGLVTNPCTTTDDAVQISRLTYVSCCLVRTVSDTDRAREKWQETTKINTGIGNFRRFRSFTAYFAHGVPLFQGWLAWTVHNLRLRVFPFGICNIRQFRLQARP